MRTLGVIVIHERFDDIDMLGTWERITSDTYTECLTESDSCSLVHRLIRKCSTSADHTNFARREDTRRHDTDLATSSVLRLHYSRTVGPNHAGFRLGFQRLCDSDLVLLRNTLGDGDD